MYCYKKAMSAQGEPVVVKVWVDLFDKELKMYWDDRHARMRVNKCTVVGFYNLDGTSTDSVLAYSYYDPNFIYYFGKTMTCEFDDRRTDHAAGIHVFCEFDKAAYFHIWPRRFTWPLWKMWSCLKEWWTDKD